MRPIAPERAWDYLLAILARQAYTVDELRRKLLRRGIEAEQAEALLARLRELRLVDDALYAQQYVSSRKAQHGRRGLHQALRRKGVADELVEREVGSLGQAQQADAATALLRRFAWRYRPAVEPDVPPEEGAGAPDEEQGAADEQEGSPYEQGLARGAHAEGDVPSRKAAAAADPRRMRARAFAFLARRGFDAEAASLALERVGWFDERP